MGSMFSSPSKQAQQGASSTQANDQQLINQYIAYTNQMQQGARGGVAGIGANPYFNAAMGMNPAPYRVNPFGTQQFGTAGPGTYLASNYSSGPYNGMPMPPGMASGGNPAQPVRMQPGGGGGMNGGGYMIPMPFGQPGKTGQELIGMLPDWMRNGGWGGGDTHWTGNVGGKNTA